MKCDDSKSKTSFLYIYKSTLVEQLLKFQELKLVHVPEWNLRKDNDPSILSKGSPKAKMPISFCSHYVLNPDKITSLIRVTFDERRRLLNSASQNQPQTHRQDHKPTSRKSIQTLIRMCGFVNGREIWRGRAMHCLMMEGFKVGDWKWRQWRKWTDAVSGGFGTRGGARLALASDRDSLILKSNCSLNVVSVNWRVF